MKKSTKQWLSALLVIAMMAGMLMVPASAAEVTDVDGKLTVEVWDFGAEQLKDTDKYHFVNHLDVDEINSWYNGMEKDGKPVEPGQSGVDFPAGVTKMAGGLYWDSNNAANHRLRTDNTALTRNSNEPGVVGDGKDPYVIVKDDEGNVTGTPYLGLLYSNSSANTNVKMGLALEAGDIVTYIVSSNGTDSQIEFVGPSGDVEGTFVYTAASRTKPQTTTFYAKEDGTYTIHSVNEKLVVQRVYRRHATEVAVTGAISGDIPAGTYSVLFTNTTTGAEIEGTVSGSNYSATLLAPYTYDVSLRGANGYAVETGREITVADTDANKTHPVKIKEIDRVKVTGGIYGLDADTLATMGQNLVFTPKGDDVVYQTEVTVDVDKATYVAMVEKGRANTISALKINDYYVDGETTKTFDADATLDVTFKAKTTYAITIEPDGATLADLADAKFIFTKLDEAGDSEDQYLVPFNPKSDSNLTGNVYNYVYTFTGPNAIALRDGIYNVEVQSGGYNQKLTSNLTVKGAATTKKIGFTAVANYVAYGLTDFKAMAPAQGTVVSVAGMKFDHVVGHQSGSNSHGLATSGGSGSITLNVKDPANITVVGCRYTAGAGDEKKIVHPTAKVNGEDVTVEVTVGEDAVNSGSVDPEYVISNVSGEVVISFSVTSYIHSINVEPAATPTVAAGEYSFVGLAANAAPSVTGMSFKGLVGHDGNDTHGLKCTGNAPYTITINLAGEATITVADCQYTNSGNPVPPTVTADGVAVPAENIKNISTAADPVYVITGVSGEVVLSYNVVAYVHGITVEYPTETYYGTEWDWRNDGVAQGTSYYATDFATGADSAAFAGTDGYGILTVTGGAKFGGHDTTHGTEGNGYTMTFDVLTACTIKVKVGYHWWVWADGEGVTSASGFTAENPATHNNKGTDDNDGSYVTFTYTGTEPGQVKIHTAASGGTIGDSYIGQILVEYDSSVELPRPEPLEDIIITVGADKDYKTITEALDAAAATKREGGQRITIEIDPGDYEEQLYIKVKDLTFKNAKADQAKLEVTDKGVKIGANEVRITWYYGHGYTYYSMTNGHRFDADVLEVNKANGYPTYKNVGSGTTDDSYWNGSVLIAADGFQAYGIIFENSFNQYVSAASVNDVIVPQGASAKEKKDAPRADMKTVGDTTVQDKAYVERAGAVSIKSGSKIYFDHCAFIGRQDVLYGEEGSTVALYNCDVYGGTDYIYGGMSAVIAKCRLVLNTSDNKDDVAYITAAQNGNKMNTKGYLMYNCTVTSTVPGLNSASTYGSKPGQFGRPWVANKGEAVFYMTNIEACDEHWWDVETPDPASTSLIQPIGWNSTLNGESALSQEYGTVEYYKGVDNTDARVAWSTVADPAKCTVAAFLGDWDPFTLYNKDMEIVLQDQQPLPEVFGTKAPECSNPDCSCEECTGEDCTCGGSSETPADKKALETAIGNAEAKLAEVDGIYRVADDCTTADVDRNTKFVYQSKVDALEAAKAAAEDVLAKEDATTEEIAKAIKAIEDAIADLKIETGTKRTSGGTNVGTGSSNGSTPASTTTKTDTTESGNVTTTTNANGDKTITVTDETGEVIAKVELPATVPALGYTFEDVPDDHWAAEAINKMAALGVVKGVSAEDHVFDMTSNITRASMAQILYNLSQGKAGIAEAFADVAEGAWYTDAIAWAAKAGVVNGYDANTFGPDDAITREQLAVMLYRYAGLLGMEIATDRSNVLGGFADVDAVSDWATEAMTWAVSAGIIQGTGEGLNPGAPASRAETAVMLSRFLDKI